MHHKAAKKSGGFTLIEVIAVLVLLGIIGALLAVVLARGIDNYFQARDSAERSQQAQLALARIEREFLDMTGIDELFGDSIMYTRDDANGIPVRFQIVGGGGGFGRVIMIDMANPQAQRTLIDHVVQFQVVATRQDGGFWDLGFNFNQLGRIGVRIGVAMPDGTVLNFETSANPRRTTVPNAPGLF